MGGGWRCWLPLLLVSCSAVPRDGAWRPGSLSEDLARLPRGLLADVRDGPFVAPAADGELAVGDELEFDIALCRGESVREWRLAMHVTGIEPRELRDGRVVPPFELRVRPTEQRWARMLAQNRELWERIERRDPSLQFDIEQPVAVVRVEVFDVEGTCEASGQSSEQTRVLQRGLLPACLAGHRQRLTMRGRVAAGRDAEVLTLDDAAFDDVAEAGEGTEACRRFFRILQDNPATRRILVEVLALPSLWSIFTNWGVKVTFAVDFFAAEPVDPALFPEAGRELWSVPMTVLLNDQPGLLAHLVVGPAGAPDGAAAGVYAIVARHPDDAERVAVVRLRASRRVAAEVSAPPGELRR